MNSGVVTLDANIAKTFDGDSGTATTAVHNIDILGGNGITTLGANNDITVSLTNKTSYWSCPGASFKPEKISGNFEIFYDSAGNAGSASGSELNWYAQVNLPHGAVITSVVVYGDEATHTWSLQRVSTSGGGTEMASGNIGTADTSISSATVDNNTNSYVLRARCDGEKTLYGVRIIYTTDYI